MDPSIELSVIKLVLNSSMFAKVIFMLLMVISIVSWSIMIHKYLFLSAYKSQLSRFLKSLTSQGDVAFLEDSCSHFSTGPAKTMPILILRLIRANSQGKLIVPPKSIIDNAALYETNKLRKGMNMLATIANVSPLVGLLGTVWGVMYSFMNIGQQGSASIAVVAPGIAEALLTTITGLCVAIPAMAGHNFLTGWLDTCFDSLDVIGDYTVSILQ